MGKLWAAKGFLETLPGRRFCLSIINAASFDSIPSYLEELDRWAGNKGGEKNARAVMLGGGGGVLFDSSGNVPLIKRSFDAPTNPGKWTLPTGRFDSDRELVEPDAMLRELWEELRICRSGAAVNGPDFFGQKRVGKLLDSNFLDVLAIRYNGAETIFSGWVSVDDRGEVNTLVPVFTEMNLSDFSFSDGETGKDGETLRRKVELYNVNGPNEINLELVTSQTRVAILNIKKLMECTEESVLTEHKN